MVGTATLRRPRRMCRLSAPGTTSSDLCSPTRNIPETRLGNRPLGCKSTKIVSDWYRGRVRIRLFFLVVLVSIGSLLVGTASAHSEVFERAPATGQVVGGTVDRVDISFWTPIESGVISLSGPNGEAIDVNDAVLATNGRVLSTEFAPLSEPGPYVVTHSERSVDGDTQTAQFAFIFDPTSEERVVPLVTGDDGPNWVLLGGISGVLLIFAGLFWPGRSSKKN